jgi:hypothetical protein
MGQVIDLCRTCGFDIPADAGSCPACKRATEPTRAARQVAGLALPTRSVHSLPTVPRRREPVTQPLGRAETARSAFSLTATLALCTFVVAGLAWVASQPRFVLTVPRATIDVLDDITTITATASIAALLIGLIAMVIWYARAAGRLVRDSGR